ncbi:MAG: hypothetical protein MI919_18775, partial [Holophagales bacterium]|nr:hypothetical protein [Holophagales bacterium]
MSQSSPIWREAARLLRESSSFARLRQCLRHDSPTEVVRLPVPVAAWVLGLAARELGRPLLVVVPHEVDAYAWLEAARLFSGGDPGEGSAFYFPAPSLTPYQEAEISLLVRAEEAKALAHLAYRISPDAASSGTPPTVITTPRALFRRLPPLSELRSARLEIAVGDEIPIDDLVDHLLSWGYQRSDLVFEVGQLAVRGGVFDLFPPGSERPLRLDLFGDTVETIRRFEPDSQRSRGSVERAEILPLSLFPRSPAQARRLADLLAKQAGPHPGAEVAERLGQLRDQGSFDGWEHYLPLLRGDTVGLAELLGSPIVACLDSAALHDEAKHHDDSLQADFRDRLEKKRLAVPPEALELPFETVHGLLDRAHVRIGDLFAGAESSARAEGGEPPVDFEASLTEMMHDRLPLLEREVASARDRGELPVLVTLEDHREKMAEMLAARDVEVGHDGVHLVSGDLRRGFRLPSAALTVWSERQLLRRSPLVKPKSKKRRYGPFLASIRDLRIGDYVVHSEHGIGQFLGLRTLGGGSDRADIPAELRAAAPEASSDVEVMEISYSGGKQLLLPLSRLDQIQKYSGIEGVAPKLDKLGGTSWRRTKSRIKKGMRDMA